MADEGRETRGNKGAEDRKAKLAAQLRANLRRRKDQARGLRARHDAEDGAETGAADDADPATNTER